MDKRLAAMLLRQFPNSSLPTKVIIAAALYVASKGKIDEEEKEIIKEMWARSIKAEIEVENIADLYEKGLADYTPILREYADISEFIVKTLAAALRGGGGEK